MRQVEEDEWEVIVPLFDRFAWFKLTQENVWSADSPEKEANLSPSLNPDGDFILGHKRINLILESSSLRTITGQNATLECY